MAQVRVGISGWQYPSWRGKFYPAGLVQRRELEYAASKMNSVEINGSFYSLQRPESYAAWAEQTPDDFLFAVKGGRYLTHMKKLKDVAVPLANFFASGLLRLGHKLGPILWQFPRLLSFQPERFEAFFAMLPRTTAAAARLAAGHDAKLEGRAHVRTDADRPIRYAVEVRHESFLVPAFIDLLRRHNIALCLADTAGQFPYAEDLTADFLYVRLHGAEKLYWSGYSDEQLDGWAKRLRTWAAGGEPQDARRVGPAAKPAARGRDLFVYFDNDALGHAPFDAVRLAERLRDAGV